MKIKVYHGSLEEVVNPEIREPNRTLDYGKGFYTTTDFLQAENWVKRHRNDVHKPSYGFVNTYMVDIDEVRKANCLWFDSPSYEWIDFVYANRNIRGFSHGYDYVYGPVANDKVYAAFALYESGILDKDDLIKELKTYNLVDQLLFHSVKSLKNLLYIESVKIEL